MPSGPANLAQITTQWSAVHDPAQFVMRYAPAIRTYLKVLLPDAHDAEDVLQEFLVRVVKNGFDHVDPSQGRFRDYLFIAVRNAGWKHLRQKQARCRREADYRQQAQADPHQSPDCTWVEEWYRCIIERAMDALYRHQRQTRNNLFHTVLRVTMDHPRTDSTAQAAEVSRVAGRPVSADAFRQQRSRALRVFARLLVEEVTQTLSNPTPERVEDELTALGLIKYVEPYLPDDWRSNGTLPT